jgi:hypothetical protein
MKPTFPRQYTAGFTTNAATAARVTFGVPLQAGDVVKSLRLFVRSTNAAAVAVDAITAALYACGTLPADATAAANGKELIPTTTLPLLPALVDPLTAATGVNWLHIEIPLLYSPDQKTRFPALVVTGGAAAITGFASLVVERPSEQG